MCGLVRSNLLLAILPLRYRRFTSTATAAVHSTPKYQHGIRRNSVPTKECAQRRILVPTARIERATSPLPRECSTTELHGPAASSLRLPAPVPPILPDVSRG